MIVHSTEKALGALVKDEGGSDSRHAAYVSGDGSVGSEIVG